MLLLKIFQILRENLESNFKIRAFSSVILLVILTLFFFLKLNFYFFLIFFLLVYLELYNNKIINIIWTIVFSLFYLLFLNYIDYVYNFVLIYKNYIFTIFIIIIGLSFIYQKILYSKILLNIFIINSFIFLTLLYKYNFSLFFIIILLTSINDTFAYIIGSYFKGPKIIPMISPNKTWSGTASSYFISIVILIFFFNFNIIYNFLLPVTFFLGDIYFSNIKRILNIKDYGQLIKGHGGLLDRFDSSFLSISFSFLFLLYL